MEMSGLDLQQKLIELESSLPVIIITAYASIPLAVKSMQNGAATFLEKTCTEHKLWRAVKDALVKNTDLLKEKQERDAMKKSMTTLTEDEKKVLNLVAGGKANKQIARALGIGLRTVEDRRHRVMRKLDVESFAELMRFYIMFEQSAQSE